jgi:hypothetical protein
MPQGAISLEKGKGSVQANEQERKHPPKVNSMRGTDCDDLAVIQSLRGQVFG